MQAFSRVMPNKETRLSTSDNSRHRHKHRAMAWWVSSRCFRSPTISDKRGFSTLRRLASGSSLRPTTAPTAAIPDSLTASFSSFMYPKATPSISEASEGSRSLATPPEKMRRIAQAFPWRMSPESSSTLLWRISSRIVSSVFSAPRMLQAAPVTFAAASLTESSEWRISLVLASRAEGMLSGSLDFLPPFCNTTARASSVAVWMATMPIPSSPTALLFPRDPATSSLIRGSTRVDNGMSSPSAVMASNRTWRDGSASAFTKVV
mmetsp:Transcript_24871/g.52952  ORF Transcript_24871/g.52952 Transcript_24871/m.52952 type:complete len:263 (+) Transcript_24871:290-1078(+)